MGFLYGDIINHLPQTNFFSFWNKYPSRQEMTRIVTAPTQEEKDEGKVPPYNVYLYVDYSLSGTYSQNANIDQATYNQGNFDGTVWQVRKVGDQKTCIAIARLHSVLPTFEVIGSYDIDILEPLFDTDYFNGKNIWPPMS